MNKSEAIQIANASLQANVLNDGNTQFSQVVRYASDEGWWLNIPLANFRKENHFLICSEKSKIIRHLMIKANNILSPATKFPRQRRRSRHFHFSGQPQTPDGCAAGRNKIQF